jgi:isoaspartyl peptidase/L-asparaginase-like protein (Ntn-hydrolase superfamily)
VTSSSCCFLRALSESHLVVQLVELTSVVLQQGLVVLEQVGNEAVEVFTRAQFEIKRSIHKQSNKPHHHAINDHTTQQILHYITATKPLPIWKNERHAVGVIGGLAVPTEGGCAAVLGAGGVHSSAPANLPNSAQINGARSHRQTLRIASLTLSRAGDVCAVNGEEIVVVSASK